MLAALHCGTALVPAGAADVNRRVDAARGPIPATRSSPLPGTPAGIPADERELGILPRAAAAVFDHVRRHSGAPGDPAGTRYQLEVQFLEVYQEEVVDLLAGGTAAAAAAPRQEGSGSGAAGGAGGAAGGGGSPQKSDIVIREGGYALALAPLSPAALLGCACHPSAALHGLVPRLARRRTPRAACLPACCAALRSLRAGEHGDVLAHNAVRVGVASSAQLLAAFERGVQLRSVGATAMNRHSSRSHAIFTLLLTRAWADVRGRRLRARSKLHLVDLAGSERQRRTGAAGQRLKVRHAAALPRWALARNAPPAGQQRRGPAGAARSSLAPLLCCSAGVPPRTS